MLNEHILKTDPEHFQAVRVGRKSFELRRNDRGILPGDFLTLEEFDRSTGNYTGEMESLLVTGAHSIKELLAEFPEADTLFSVRLAGDAEAEMTRMYEFIEDEMKVPQAEIEELLKENAALKDKMAIQQQALKTILDDYKSTIEAIKDYGTTVISIGQFGRLRVAEKTLVANDADVDAWTQKKWAEAATWTLDCVKQHFEKIKYNVLDAAPESKESVEFWMGLFINTLGELSAGINTASAFMQNVTVETKQEASK